MIQRIQTLFLLGIAICMGIYISLPIWEKISSDGTQRMLLDAFGFKTFVLNDQNNWELVSASYPYYIAIAAGLTILVTAYSIFRYDNRLTQIKLGALIALLIMVAVGLSVYVIYQNEMAFDPGVKATPKIGFFIPLIALMFNSLANRFIRRDEKLVRSVDRLR